MARHKKYPVVLTDDEIRRLKKVLRNKDTSKTIANRCRVLLELDTSHPPVLYYRIVLQSLASARARFPTS